VFLVKTKFGWNSLFPNGSILVCEQFLASKSVFCKAALIIKGNNIRFKACWKNARFKIIIILNNVLQTNEEKMKKRKKSFEVKTSPLEEKSHCWKRIRRQLQLESGYLEQMLHITSYQD